VPELPPRRSALASAYRTGTFGAILASGPGISLRRRSGLGIIQLAANPVLYNAIAERLTATLKITLPKTPNQAIGDDRLAALWTGPGRVFLVVDGARDLEAELRGALAGMAVGITALGHSRTVLRATGPRLRTLLSMGCGLDFHSRVFSAGDCVQSSYSHINVLFHAVDDHPTVDLYVYRGFALSLWEHLVAGALQFGCQVTEEDGPSLSP
jgi:heterotetrameric sarcosine oxidase gamma subunit